MKAEFATQTNHQAPLEPEVSSAYFEGEGENRELVVVGRSINIHFHLNQLKESLGCEKMRYKEAFSGGQFGIKVWIITEAIAGAAAMHFNRPIRYCSHHGRIDAHHHQTARLSQHEDQARRR